MLSWYETIKLDKARALREGSKWTSDPAKIDEREEAANFMAAYADTSFLDAGRAYTDAEEEEEEAPREEEGSSDSAAADDDSGDDEDDDDEEVAAPEAPAPEVPQAGAGADVDMADPAADAANTSAGAIPDAANASANAYPDASNTSASATSDAANTSASANPAADPQASNTAA